MASRFTASLGLLALVGGVAFARELSDVRPAPPPRDVYQVTLDRAARDEPATGRVILFFFFVETGGRRAARSPAFGPFFDPPQPIASVAVDGLAPGASVEIDRAAVSFPESIDTLDGRVRVQAVLDADETERSPLQGPGNVVSEVVETDLSPERADRVELALTRAIRPRRFRARPNLEWIELRSEMLSAYYGRNVFHRAGVALPLGYGDPAASRREWPTVYVIPDFGGREELAATYARMLATPRIEEIAPIAVYVVLDPESPLGHHGFTDSPNHGPRGTALVTEVIPALEARFRLVPRAEARIVTGNSSGGWASLWLLLRWPEVFGAAWASGPDPIDFRAFQVADLYEDENLYWDRRGHPQPAFRVLVSVDGDMQPSMTVREEGLMERTIDPFGASGRQWDAWEAMFSPRGTILRPVTGRPLPRPMFDAVTGAIDRSVVARWSRFDISRKVVGDWAQYGPIVMERARIACGGLDSYYLDRSVRLFKERVEDRAEAGGGWTGPGYVEIVPDETHSTLTGAIYQRWNREMREYLQQRELHD